MDALKRELVEHTRSGDFGRIQNLFERRRGVLMRSAPDLDRLLDELDPLGYTLVHICVLDLKAGGGNSAEYRRQVGRCFMNLDRDQLNSCIAKASRVADTYARFAIQAGTTRAAVYPLLMLCRGLGEGVGVTPAHRSFLSVCLAAGIPNIALPILATPRLSVKHCTKAEDVLLYYYYGGIVYASLRRFKEARRFFEQCVVYPSNDVSLISYKAYLKWKILYAWDTGLRPAIPEMTSAAVERILKMSGDPYTNLAECIAGLDLSGAERIVQQHREEYLEDRNLGLARELARGLVEKNVKRLVKTHAAMTFRQIADRLPGVGAIECKVLGMVERGEVVASIDEKNRSVSFSEVASGGTGWTTKFIEKIRQVSATNKELDRILTRIGTNDLYLQKNFDRALSKRRGP